MPPPAPVPVREMGEGGVFARGRGPGAGTSTAAGVGAGDGGAPSPDGYPANVHPDAIRTSTAVAARAIAPAVFAAEVGGIPLPLTVRAEHPSSHDTKRMFPRQGFPSRRRGQGPIPPWGARSWSSIRREDHRTKKGAARIRLPGTLPSPGFPHRARSGARCNFEPVAFLLPGFGRPAGDSVPPAAEQGYHPARREDVG